MPPIASRTGSSTQGSRAVFRRRWRWWTAALILVGIVVAAATMPRPWQRRAPLQPEQVEAEIPERWRPLVGSVRAWQAAEPAEREDFLRWMGDVGLEIQRQKARQLVKARHGARTARASRIIEELFAFLALASLLLLLLPFFVSKREAPRRVALWVHTVLATGTLLLSWLLLQGCVELLVRVSSNIAAMASPEEALIDAGFDRIHADVHARLDALGTADAVDPDTPPHAVLFGSSEAHTAENYVRNILASVEYVEPERLRSIETWAARLWSIFGYVPLGVPFVVVIVVLLTMRATLAQVILMPIEAGRGTKGSGRRAIGRALMFVFREFLAIAGLILMLVPVGVLGGLAMRRLGHDMVGLVLAQGRTTVAYFGELAAPPDEARLGFGLLAVPAYLALATLLGTGGITLFGLRARRLLQMKFHHGWPLRRADRIWRRSFMAALRLQWIPVLLLWAMAPGLVALHGGTPADAADALGRMTSTGTRLALAFPIAFLLLGGIGALVRLWPLRRLAPAAKGAYTLRDRTPADDDVLRQIHHAGLREHVEATWGTWDEPLQDRFVDEWLATTPAQLVLVDGEPAGYLEIEDRPTQVHIANIVLLPAVQGRGIGTRILTDVIEDATTRGLPVHLQVMRANPARALYERLGFRAIGETEHHIQMIRPPPPVP